MNYALVALLATAAALYLWMVCRYDRRRNRRLNRWHVAAFAGSIVTLYFALEPPLDALADRSFLAHMAAHILLVYVAAPLFLLGAPVMVFLGSLDTAHARRAGRFLNSPIWRSLTFPVFTWFFFTAVMWSAHFSPLYELALVYPAVHVLEHALFFTAAILFWQAIIHIGPVAWPMNFALRIVYVFLAMPQSAFLGLALYESKFVLYPHYLASHDGSSAAALADQHSGGALMWIFGGLLLFIVFMLVAAMWGHSERRLGERLDAGWESELRRGVVGSSVVFAIFIWGARCAVAGVSQGEQLYQIHCSSCHGGALEGSARAPSLRDVSIDAVDFYLTTGRMPAIVPSVQNEHRTPSFSPGQIEALATFVMSRSHGSTTIPYVDNAGNLQRGRSLYIANCAACHGATAQGDSVGYGWVAPPLDRATVTQVAEAIRVGPGVMPRFDERTLSNREVNDIVRYVNVLQTDVPNAGGLSLGSLGPVAEGLVAWVFGMGTLVVVIKLIGRDA